MSSLSGAMVHDIRRIKRYFDVINQKILRLKYANENEYQLNQERCDQFVYDVYPKVVIMYSDLKCGVSESDATSLYELATQYGYYKWAERSQQAAPILNATL